MTKPDTLHGLRTRCGMTEVALHSFELDHPQAHLIPAERERHQELLRQNQESKDWLLVAEAQLTGRMNFTPDTKKKRKTTATN
jgi:hypothetical protein